MKRYEAESGKPIFDDTPEYKELKEGYRQKVLTTIDEYAQSIKTADTLAELHDLPYELQGKLKDLSYKFFVEDLSRAIMRWERKQRSEG
jgi:hypothetical protein